MARQPKFLPPKPGKENLLIKRKKQEGAESINEALQGMKGGETRSGFLGDGNIIRQPDFVPEPDKVSDALLKKTMQKLLASVIEPNPLSNKSTAEMDKRSLVNKLNRRSLDELKELLPRRIRRFDVEKIQGLLDGAISEEEKVEIQGLYMEVSP